MNGPTEELAMFPLGTVLLPHGHLSLRVFEPRYLDMMDQLGPEGGRFGVVLIDRGPEVGGGELRTSIGCGATITQSAPGPAEDLYVSARGTTRLTVVDWFTDDPFPRARVRELPDPDPVSEDPVHARLVERFDVLVELVAARGQPTPGDIELGSGPVERGYRIAEMLPLGPLDAFAVLSAADPEQRAHLLIEAIEGVELVLRSQPPG